MGAILKATKGGGASVKAPAGNHLAILVGMFEMGRQEDRFNEGKTKLQIYMLWELVDEQIAGTTKNHVLGRAVTMSLNSEANLRAWIDARTGTEIPDDGSYDIGEELGKPCMLNVVLSNDWPQVDSVAAVPKRTTNIPKPTYPPTYISIDDVKAGKEVPEWVPWFFGSPLIEHIRACEEVGGPKPKRKAKKDLALAAAGTTAEDRGEVIPF
jgi:hypothetical protein